MPAPISRHASRIAPTMVVEDSPGTIVADFEALMDFLATGVRSTGKYHLLPMARLNELDELMTTPLRPQLQRPQQRSFPHLHGLYMLLRATRIGMAVGHGKATGKLVLDPFMCEQWAQLNSTEKYCNLLEAWLRVSSWQSIGGAGSSIFSGPAVRARDVWQSVPQEGRRFSKKEQAGKGFFYCEEQMTSLALLELFGFMTVVRGKPIEGISWAVEEIGHTPFGDQMLTLIVGGFDGLCFSREQSDLDFGVWQKALQPMFPHWVNNLKFPEPVFRDGIFYFKVSLGKPWRRIAIAAEHSLEELADCIISAFDFDGDHLHRFQIRDSDGKVLSVNHPAVTDADLHTDEFAIGYLPVEEGQAIPFDYDFGADWQFTVTLEKIAPPNPEITQPIIVESRGKAPAEYDDNW
jgi:hypothetical protein